MLKKSLFRLTIIVLVVLIPRQAWSYDHSEVAPSGQTLYYNLAPSGATVVYPGPGVLHYWDGYEKPVGTLIIPDSVLCDGVKYPVVAVGGYAFSRCDSITAVILPACTKSIKSAAFAHCSALSSVSLPDSLKSIGWWAFQYDSSLTQITLPQGLDSIENGAFWGTRLTHISIPASVTYIRDIASYCPTLESITVDNGNPNYDSRNGCNAIIETASNTLVVGCKNSVIPEGIEKIDHSAFAGCTGLVQMNIPESVKEIGSFAFAACQSLASVTLPSNLKRIEDATFAESGLVSITIPDSVWYIGEQAFCRCTQLEAINFGASVKQIEEFAFFDCKALQSVLIPKSVSYIFYAPFGGCDALQSLVVDEENENFSSRNGCNAIFRGNTLWQACPTTVIPSGVTEIFVGAYLGFSSFDTIIIPEGVTTIEREAFGDCDNLLYVRIPNSVTRIDNAIFYGCRSLEEVSIGSGIEKIGGYVFDSTACGKLHIRASIPPAIDSTTLRGLRPDATIYVPCGAGDVYKNTAYWNNYSIEEEECNGIDGTEATDLQISTSNGCITVEGVPDGMIKVFDVGGCQVRNESLATGVYIVKIGDYATRKVVVAR